MKIKILLFTFSVFMLSFGQSDNFNRADENPLANSTWASAYGYDAGCRISSNRVTSPTVGWYDNASLWTSSGTFTDQRAKIVLVITNTEGSSFNGAGIMLRGSTTQRTGYQITWSQSAATVYVARWVNGSFTDMGNFAQAFSNGDSLWASIIGTTIRIYRNNDSVHAYTDANISSGYPGIYHGGSEYTFADDWSAGSVGSCTPGNATQYGNIIDTVGNVRRWLLPVSGANDSVGRYGTWPDSTAFVNATANDSMAARWKAKFTKAAVHWYSKSCTGAGADIDTVHDTITIVGTVPAYTNAPFSFSEDQAISIQSITSMSGVDSVTSGTLPTGLSLNITTGDITGTPTTVQGATNVRFITWNNGWKIDSADISFTITAATTYTVSYNANGGTGTMTDASSPYDSNATVTVLSNSFTPPAGGFYFLRFNTAANGSGTNYNPAATFSILANTTLYAQWDSMVVIDSVLSKENGTTIYVDDSVFIYGKHFPANMACSSNGNAVPFVFTNSGLVKIKADTITTVKVGSDTIIISDGVTVDSAFFTVEIAPPDTFTVTISITGNHLTEPNIDTTPFTADGRYETGTEITITATQAALHKLVPTATFPASPLVFTITRDTTIIIQSDTFPKYTRTIVHIGAHATVSTVPETVSPVDSSVACTTSVSGITEGWRCDSIKSNASVVYYPATRITYIIAQNRIDSVFVSEIPVIPDSSNISFSQPANGTITIDPVALRRAAGDTTQIVFDPAAHYHFGGWTGGLADSTNDTVNYVFPAAGTVTFSAVAWIDTHTVTLVDGDNVNLTALNGTAKPWGAVCSVAVRCSTGYAWRVESGPWRLVQDTTLLIAVTKDTTMTAESFLIPTDARSVVISPASLTIDTGSTRQFTATYYDTIGRVANPQPATTWAATVGSINASGLFTAGSDTGSGIVRGYNGLIADTATVRVRYKSGASSVNRWNWFGGSFRTAWRRFR